MQSPSDQLTAAPAPTAAAPSVPAAAPVDNAAAAGDATAAEPAPAPPAAQVLPTERPLKKAKGSSSITARGASLTTSGNWRTCHAARQASPSPLYVLRSHSQAHSAAPVMRQPQFPPLNRAMHTAPRQARSLYLCSHYADTQQSAAAPAAARVGSLPPHHPSLSSGRSTTARLSMPVSHNRHAPIPRYQQASPTFIYLKSLAIITTSHP
jgi:hypothetical protein